MMIPANDSTKDYKGKNSTITVESVFSEDKTIKEVLREYLIQNKDLPSFPS